ncbi:response regulator [Kitasatospora sp. NPDC096128]|uniref:response regulator transcription factor n=1 Tax=Kitasatospora sp. NPDC096128 TaxID=3155547 RepID=UPI00332FB9EB
MTQPLTNIQILVADDQTDVAKTLCMPLRRAKARLTFVGDGQAALDALAAQPFDLILIDMKMPPEEWGGLWLLRQLHAEGSRIPTLVLSGEGAKQQVKLAMRLGATDWIDKDDADQELLDRVTTVLASHHEQTLTIASEQLPTPIASRLARYIRTTDPEKQLTEGLHALESVLRFAAVVGLSSTPPFALPGITIEKLAAPAMGTWFNVCTALADGPDASSNFRRLFACVAPDSAARQHLQGFIPIRNGIFHDSADPHPEDLARLDAYLRRISHRMISCGAGDLAVAKSMTYDGEKYAVELLSLRGTGKPSPDALLTSTPVVSGTVLLVAKDVEPIPLSPLMATAMAEPPGSVQCLQFNGFVRGKGELGPTSALKFARTNVTEEHSSASHPSLTWPAVAAWTSHPRE